MASDKLPSNSNELLSNSNERQNSPNSNNPSSSLPSLPSLPSLNSNIIKQTIKYILLSLILLTSIMYVPKFKLSVMEIAIIIIVSIGSLMIMDHWCPSVRYCLRNMDACINHKVS